MILRYGKPQMLNDLHDHWKMTKDELFDSKRYQGAPTYSNIGPLIRACESQQVGMLERMRSLWNLTREDMIMHHELEPIFKTAISQPRLDILTELKIFWHINDDDLHTLTYPGVRPFTPLVETTLSLLWPTKFATVSNKPHSRRSRHNHHSHPHPPPAPNHSS